MYLGSSEMAPITLVLEFAFVLITVACATAAAAADQVQVPVEQAEARHALFLLWWYPSTAPSTWCLGNADYAWLLLVAVIIGVSMPMLRHRQARSIVPFATLNVLDVVRGMTSEHPHIYLLDLARTCKRKTFRLPLPIFRVVRIHWGWGRRHYFYLPLPMLRRVFVVGASRPLGASCGILRRTSHPKYTRRLRASRTYRSCSRVGTRRTPDPSEGAPIAHFQ